MATNGDLLKKTDGKFKKLKFTQDNMSIVLERNKPREHCEGPGKANQNFSGSIRSSCVTKSGGPGNLHSGVEFGYRETIGRV